MLTHGGWEVTRMSRQGAQEDHATFFDDIVILDYAYCRPCLMAAVAFGELTNLPLS